MIANVVTDDTAAQEVTLVTEPISSCQRTEREVITPTNSDMPVDIMIAQRKPQNVAIVNAKC